MPEVTIENCGGANVPDSGQRRSDQKLTVRSYRISKIKTANFVEKRTPEKPAVDDR